VIYKNFFSFYIIVLQATKSEVHVTNFFFRKSRIILKTVFVASLHPTFIASVPFSGRKYKSKL